MAAHGAVPAQLRTRTAAILIAVWQVTLGASSSVLLIAQPASAMTRYGLVLVAITYAALAAYVARVRRTHGDVNCGCLGNDAHRTSRAAVARNLCFGLAALASIPMTSTRIGVYVWVASVAGAGSACLAVVVVRDLVAALKRPSAS